MLEAPKGLAIRMRVELRSGFRIKIRIDESKAHHRKARTKSDGAKRSKLPQVPRYLRYGRINTT